MQSRLATAILICALSVGFVSCGGDRDEAATVDPNSASGAALLPEQLTVVALPEGWRFFPNRFCVDDCGEPEHVFAVGAWNQKEGLPEMSDGRGFGTYEQVLDLPPAWRDQELALWVRNIGSAFRLYVNGRELYSLGEPGQSEAEEYARVQAVVIPLRSPADAEPLRVQLHISNFIHKRGGLRNAPSVGPSAEIFRQRDQELLADLVLLGAILIMGFYHFGLFINRREDYPALLFGVFCMLMALRMTTSNHVPLQILFPGLPYLWQARIEYFSFLFGASSFILFLAYTFQVPYGRRSAWAYTGVCRAYSLIVLFSSAYFFSTILWQMQLLLVVGILLGPALYIAAGMLRRRGVLASALGMFAFAFTVVSDILYYRGVHDLGVFFHYGLFFFILSQSYLLSQLFAWAFIAVRDLSDSLRSTNRSYERFVPTQFLELLERKDITQVQLGDQTEREMTVLFTDIRSFTDLSETLTPEENFNFLNSYLKRMAPIVSAHGGFIDKYIGDAIMALFPGSPENAVSAAVAMQAELRRYNEHRASMNYQPIRIGIGIHTGQLMLGIVGAEERLEGTVISDTVNTAARVEGLTRSYGVSLLISGTVRRRLEEINASFTPRLLGRVRVKGRQQGVEIYELIEAYAESERPAYFKTQAAFEAAVNAALRGRRAEAEAGFRQVLNENPDDSVAACYLERDRLVV